MKRNRLFSGMLLLGIGILFLLDNFKVINFHWENVISLWPLFLIISGVNLVFSHYNHSNATPIKILIFVAVFIIIIYRGAIMPRDNHFWGRQFNNNTFFNDDNNSDDDDDNNSKNVFKVEGSSTYKEPYTAAVKVASLNINGGGATYTLKDTTTELFSAATHELSGRFSFNTTATDSGKTITFNNDNKKNSVNWGNGKSNQATIKLNSNPVWNINVATGASKLEMDLTKFKIRNLHVTGGASSMDVKLGEPVLGNTTVDISTGVSEVNISVPTGAACHINSKTGLSSKTFDGFESKSDNQYETTGFAAASKKIYINLKGGISDFSVKRY